MWWVHASMANTDIGKGCAIQEEELTARKGFHDDQQAQQWYVSYP